MPPGTHRLTARNASGISETQVLTLRAGELNPTALLSWTLAEVPGSYRFTLGDVLSPLPEGVEFELRDGAAFFLNAAQERPQKAGDIEHVMVHNFITSLEAEVMTTAVLRIEFPELMHRIKFHFLANFDEGHATLEVAYRVDGMNDWVDLQLTARTVVQTAKVPPDGTKRFELRARIMVKQVVPDWSTARFLSDYIDNPNWHPPAFAIVADKKRQ